MKTAKLFQNGKDQFVCLPKEFHFDGKRVYVKRVGNAVTLFPCQNSWDIMLDSLALFSEDFMNERPQPPAQDREDIFSGSG